jgi:hypothetical protein
MKTQTLTLGTGLLFAAAILVTPAFAAGVQDDCRLTPPPDTTPDSTMSDNVPDSSTATTNSLTDRLTTCGSVLDPPSVGDPDIVEPAPPVGDDMNLHPDAPEVRP